MSLKKPSMKLARSLFGVSALAVLLAGCGSGKYPMDTLTPYSNLTVWIYHLFLLVTWLDMAVLVVVCVAFALAVFWFSSRVGDPGEPSSTESHLGLELAWTLIPAGILLAISIPTVQTIIHTQPDKWTPNTLTIKVVAHQWWWEFDYPSYNFSTANEIHVPTGRKVHLELVSADIIHSFWVPAVAAKRDVVPGQENQITFTADKPGEYYGQCAEFCGLSHANMRIRMFVQTPEDFDKWAAHEAAAPDQPASAEAKAGEKVFKDAPCAICHEIKGISGFSKEYAGKFRGPDLTHFGSRTTLAAGLMPNTPQDLAKWIEDPRAIKPGVNMPTLGVRGKDLDDLVAYLESLK
jgi:cytochrome c oxidase subunit II